MEIKQRKGYFLLKGKNAKVGLFFGTDPSNFKLQDEVDFFVGADCRDVFSVNSPGEYELKGVFVMALDKNGSSQYVITMEGITVLLSSSDIKVTDQDLDNIGNVNILLLREGVEYSSELVKFVNRFDPHVLLLRGDEATVEDVKKLFGVDPLIEEKKFVRNASEFIEEEYKLEVILLDAK